MKNLLLPSLFLYCSFCSCYGSSQGSGHVTLTSERQEETVRSPSNPSNVLLAMKKPLLMERTFLSGRVCTVHIGSPKGPIHIYLDIQTRAGWSFTEVICMWYVWTLWESFGGCWEREEWTCVIALRTLWGVKIENRWWKFSFRLESWWIVWWGGWLLAREHGDEDCMKENGDKKLDKHTEYERERKGSRVYLCISKYIVNGG
jgi:hypothetical protein